MREEKQISEKKNHFFGASCNHISDANLGVLGIPWDISSSFRLGSAKAPSIIRESTTSRLYNPYTEKGINIKEKWHIFDTGDIDTSSQNESTVKEKVFNTLEEIFPLVNNFLFLGGDHLSTYFSVCALMRNRRRSNKTIGILYLDSHPDLYSDYEGNQFSHACVLQRIMQETSINPENICQVGIRAATPEQLDFIDRTGISMISTDDLLTKGIKFVVNEIIESFDDSVEEIYLSIDLDVLDPAFAPGVGNPEPGGLSTSQLVQIIKNITNLPITSFDIVEFNPNYDYSNISAFTVAKLIKEVLGILNLLE